jgi:hypothetical protein
MTAELRDFYQFGDIAIHLDSHIFGQFPPGPDLLMPQGQLQAPSQ